MATTVTATGPNRHDDRHKDELPDWMTKSQVANYLQVSLRQVEILTQKDRICQPVYLGTASPRWKRSELLASLEAGQDGGR